MITWSSYDGLNWPTARTADGLTTTFARDAGDRFTVAATAEITDTLWADAAGRTDAISVGGGTRYALQAACNMRDLRTDLRITAP